MMKLLTVPLHLLVRLVVVPVKLVLATGQVTFRAGYLLGAAPVKGGAAAGRALGVEGTVVFLLGGALGIVIGHKLLPLFLRTPVPEPPQARDVARTVAADV